MIFKHSTVVLQPNHIVKSFKYGIPDRNQLQGRTDNTPQKRMLKQLYFKYGCDGIAHHTADDIEGERKLLSTATTAAIHCE